jgi:ABC-2 type transport system ATP-binding protein
MSIVTTTNELIKKADDFYNRVAALENIPDTRKKTILLKSRLNVLLKQAEAEGLTTDDLDALADEAEKMGQELHALAALLDTEVAQEKSNDDFEAVREHFLKKVPDLPALVVAQGISKRYGSGGFKLEKLNLTINAGEIVGLVGANGNGKTTLLKIIGGMLKQDQGVLTYKNLNVNENDWAAIKSKIAYLPQDVPVTNGTVLQNLQLAASLHGLTGKENQTWVEYYLHRFELWNDSAKEIRELAGGQRLRYTLAKILIGKPSLVLLDEPLANLDINMKTTLLNDLRTLADSATAPLGIMITSHDLAEVEKVTDKMLVLNNGNVLYEGRTKDIGISEPNNVFEIDCDMDYFTFTRKMAGLEGVRIDNRITSYIVYTPTQTGAKELLTYFINNDIIPESFADISHSSKRMIIKPA